MVATPIDNPQIVPRIKVIDAAITALPLANQIDLIIQWARQRSSRSVFAANVHMLMEAQSDRQFQRILNRADLVSPDGMPLVWVMRNRGSEGQKRIAGYDLYIDTCKAAEQARQKVFFLGSTDDTLEIISDRLKVDFPNLEVAGMESPPFRPLTPEEDQALVDRINGSGASIIFVALGCPKQEKWIAAHRGRIQGVMMGIGAVFAFYACTSPRAPKVMQDLGLEWLHRLMQEPTRLWHRYASTIPGFLWSASKQILSHRPPEDYELVNLSAVASPRVPVGTLLAEAGFLTEWEIQEVLQQQQRNPQQRFGDILVQQGKLSAQTIDFLVEDLPFLKNVYPRRPLGHYFKSAGLLDDSQIDFLLKKQRQAHRRFGEEVVNRGILPQTTVEFFLKELLISS